MYSDWVGPVTLGGLAVWLLGLSILVWKQNVFLKSLFPKSGSRDIRVKFEEVLREVFGLGQNLNKLKDQLLEVEKLGLKHVQRVELLRYNPYQDSGGDQSFSLTLLDDEGNGIVLTSLHARSGTRIFAKPIILGKGGKYRLSKEEEMIVKKAIKNG